MPYIAMLKNLSEKFPDPEPDEDDQQNLGELPCPNVRLWWQNFHEDMISDFYVKLVRDKQTDRQRRAITSCDGVQGTQYRHVEFMLTY